MRTSTLIALGIGAAAISMMDQKRRKKAARFLQPMANMEMAQMMPTKRTMKKISKSMMRAMS